MWKEGKSASYHWNCLSISLRFSSCCFCFCFVFVFSPKVQVCLSVIDVERWQVKQTQGEKETEIKNDISQKSFIIIKQSYGQCPVSDEDITVESSTEIEKAKQAQNRKGRNVWLLRNLWTWPSMKYSLWIAKHTKMFARFSAKVDV